MSKQYYSEGLSDKGSEGLGGHGEGFEIQNQGVTRRFPGEGPGVNGGRTQSQEMDSMEQPQYKNEGNVGDPLSDEEHYGHANWLEPVPGEDDAPEGFMTCPACRGCGVYLATGLTSDVDEFCPECQGTGVVSQFKENSEVGLHEMFEPKPIKILWSPGEYGTDAHNILSLIKKSNEGWVGKSLWMKLSQTGPVAEVPMDQDEASFLHAILANFLTTRTYTKPEAELADDVLQQLQPVLGENAELEKKSEKEKKEHPWASDKIAHRIAKDHMKLGEQVKRLYKFSKG